MTEHRLVKGTTLSCFSFSPPFSSFEYVDTHFGESFAIRRLFSLARSQSANTCVVEDIPAIGFIADENEEIRVSAADYVMSGLKRISFWTTSFTSPDTQACTVETLVGYAILKQDVVPSSGFQLWHVYEAVFKRYNHEHNCVPQPGKYSIRVADIYVDIYGVLYAQQNLLNKACAQVALRSLISRIRPEDISYKQINDIARALDSDFNPANGLRVPHIQAVLQYFGIPYRDLDYSKYDEPLSVGSRSFNGTFTLNRVREIQPYQNFLYPGIESGLGALVGFRVSTQDGRKHIIPFYGHTFNKDTWAPDADVAYFRLGANLGYISSQHWTSSFLGHDDNFGANFCIPRLYIDSQSVDYVCELLKPRFVVGGSQAEALSVYFLKNLLDTIDSSRNIWLNRLANHGGRSSVFRQTVLRAIAVDKATYIGHIRVLRDWAGNQENSERIDLFNRMLPESFWLVEISIPQVFAANERKLGEVIIDAHLDIDVHNLYQHLHYFRLPGGYYLLQTIPSEGAAADFQFFPSDLISHVDVFRF